MDTSGIDGVLTRLRAVSALAAGAPQGGEGPAPAAGDFARALGAALDRVNGMQHEAAKLSMQYEQGDGAVNLHEVMISLQKANISFQTMVQVRNKLVAAYHDIMNMQV